MADPESCERQQSSDVVRVTFLKAQDTGQRLTVDVSIDASAILLQEHLSLAGLLDRRHTVTYQPLFRHGISGRIMKVDETLRDIQMVTNGLIFVDEREYGSGPYESVFMTILEGIGLGVAGNLSYELVKSAMVSFRARVVAARRQFDPLSEGEAVSIATATAMIFYQSDAVDVVHAEFDKTMGTWRIDVLTPESVIVPVVVPPGDPQGRRVSLQPHFIQSPSQYGHTARRLIEEILANRRRGDS